MGTTTTEEIARLESNGRGWIDASRQAIADAEEAVTEMDERTRGFVREHPMAALAIAVGTGFAIGRIASKW